MVKMKRAVLFFLLLGSGFLVVHTQSPNRELLDMIKSEDLAKLEKYTKENLQEINKEISSYGYPVFFAIDSRKYNAAYSMIAAGASVTIKDEDDENIIHRIAKKAGDIKKRRPRKTF